jgi:pimeloyl-ACP methyl ester carboxylesterase
MQQGKVTALARGPFAPNPDLGYNPTMRCVRAPLSAVRRRRQSARQAQLMRSSDVSEQAKPTIVFAHGLWADGSCYSKVIPRLLADGFQVISTQNHLNTVADDAAAVRTSFARAHGPVVLVGHSYGGTVITAAGTDERVGALVYICAFAPEEGATTLVDQNKYPPTPIFQHVEVVDGRIWLRPTGVPEFAGDLPEAEQQLVWSTQMAPLADLFDQPVPGAAWQHKPTSYIVGSNDRTIQPELQRFLAARMKAKVTEVASSHVPMLSQPQRVYDVIVDAAASVGR